MVVISLQAASFPGNYTTDKPGIQSKIPSNRRYIARILQIYQSKTAKSFEWKIITLILKFIMCGACEIATEIIHFLRTVTSS